MKNMFTEYLVDNSRPPKNITENIKQLKIQHLFNNPQKNTAAVTSTPLNTDFRNLQAKKVLR